MLVESAKPSIPLVMTSSCGNNVSQTRNPFEQTSYTESLGPQRLTTQDHAFIIGHFESHLGNCNRINIELTTPQNIFSGRQRLPDSRKPIRFKDAAGRQFSFPFRLCATWAVRFCSASPFGKASGEANLARACITGHGRAHPAGLYSRRHHRAARCQGSL